MQTVHAQSEPFASTHWSVVLAAASSQADEETSHAALAQLCETYWPPLYSFVRARGYSPHDAQDTTQGFFAYLIEHRIYTRADQQKGKFRSFLLASLKHFLSHERERVRALKRGGGIEFVPLHENRADMAESLFKKHRNLGAPCLGENDLFERAWAETLVTAVLERVGAAYKAEGKEELFDVLRVFLTVGAAPLPSYAELSVRLGMPEPTLRSHVTRLRARYREALREEVRRTVSSESEIDEELRALFRVLAST
ncbi:sigma factor [soil metagenome]